MLDRELTYSMPFERLSKLSRKMGRKFYRGNYVAVWATLVGYFAMMAVLVFFSDFIHDLEVERGIPDYTWFALAVVVTLVALFFIRRSGRAAMKQRANYDADVRFREDADGLRFATPEIEYFLKWGGISQMVLEPDGVVFSHGALVFLVPNEAFANLAERDALARDVYGRLTDVARERSKAFVLPVSRTA